MNYLQTEHVGKSWEKSAIFLAAGMLCNPDKGTSGLKAQREPPCRSGAPGQTFKSIVIL